LLKGKERIFKYENLILIFPGLKEPLGMVEGFEKFCSEFQMSFQVISSFEDKEIQQGDVYVIPSDRDLVKVIEQAKLQQLALGNHYGIISYNDTPLKKVVENGITTISTDFKAMGRILADMILNHTKTQIENECYLIERNSL
jgi:DNA-binding LacI/PurR family transcriptional regulator